MTRTADVGAHLNVIGGDELSADSVAATPPSWFSQLLIRSSRSISQDEEAVGKAVSTRDGMTASAAVTVAGSS